MASPIFHETVISDIVDIMKDGIDVADNLTMKRSSTRQSISRYSSVTKAASELTMITPVVCSSSISKESAMMISKALERRNVSMYQMLFSAYSITNATDAVSHLRQFHTNLDIDKLNLDKFIDVMDNLQESVEYSYINPALVKALTEACNASMYDEPAEDINESSLTRFREVSTYSGNKIVSVNEDINYPPRTFAVPDKDNNGRFTHDANSNVNMKYATPGDKEYGDILNVNNSNDRRIENIEKNKLDREKLDYQKKRDKADDVYRAGRDDKKDRNDAKKNNRDDMIQQRQQITSQLLPSDVKKANEMQPSLMIVNFYVNDESRDLNIGQQFVCGVKSKLYLTDPDTVMNKIITKNADSDVLLRLIKVSTGEISFVKDFLLAIDNAKIDALAKSKKKSGSAVFRALEKRALKSKVRKGLRTNNYYKNVAALVISQEEVEQLEKYNNIDVMDPKVIVPIMDELALMYFVVVDELSESVSLLISGSYDYETYTFSSLERESGDSNYKKIVNLMTKVAR